MALTDKAKVKTFASVPASDTSLDAAIDLLIPQVDRRIRTDTGVFLEAQTSVTEFLDGNGLADLLLRETPVTSVTDVFEDADGFYGQGTDSPFAATDKLVAGDDYALVLDDPEDQTRSLTGTLRRLSATGWPVGSGNVKVVYDSGYLTVPKDVELAATMQVAHLLRKVQNRASEGPVVSERLGDYAVRYAVEAAAADADLLPEVQSLLRPYRRFVVA